MLNDNEFNVFEKAFSTLVAPSNGEVRDDTASPILFNPAIKPIPIPDANNVPKSMFFMNSRQFVTISFNAFKIDEPYALRSIFFTVSIIFEIVEFTVSLTVLDPSSRPWARPNITNVPIIANTVDGE